MEKAATYDCLFTSIDPKELFPEMTATMSQSRLTAYAHVWFAETMATCRRYYNLSRAYYHAAIEMDPSCRR